MKQCILVCFYLSSLYVSTLTEGIVNRTIHIICMYVYKWSVDIILIVNEF